MHNYKRGDAGKKSKVPAQRTELSECWRCSMQSREDLSQLWTGEDSPPVQPLLVIPSSSAGCVSQREPRPFQRINLGKKQLPTWWKGRIPPAWWARGSFAVSSERCRSQCPAGMLLPYLCVSIGVSVHRPRGFLQPPPRGGAELSAVLPGRGEHGAC